MTEKYKGHIAMVITNLIFGINIPVTKSVLSNGAISPLSLTLMRMCGGALLFWAASLAMPRERVARKDLLLLFLASLLGIQLNQTSFVVGLSMTTPISASIIATITPILTMLFAALFLREPITWKKGVGVALGACGALLLILNSVSPVDGTSHTRGDLLCLLSCFSYAGYLTLFKPLIMRYSPVTLMKWMFLFAVLCCTPFGYKDLWAIDAAALPTELLLQTGFVVFMATFIAYMLIPVGQKFLRPTLVSMYNYMQPLVAALVAVAVGLDLFGWDKAFAGLLVFVGVWVVNKSKSREQVEAEQARAAVEPQPDAGVARERTG